MVNSRATSVSGLTAGEEDAAVPILALEAHQHEPAHQPGDERDAEVHQHRPGDPAHADVHDDAVDAEQRRQEREEHPGVDPVQQHLEDRVQRHQSGHQVRVPTGEVVPHQHHRDAARQPHEDEALRIPRHVPEEHDRQGEHHQRPDHPVLDEREREHPAVAERGAELLIADLGQGRVHHQDQPDRDRDVGGPHLPPLDEGLEPGRGVPEGHARRHREEDPEREEPVEGRQSGGDG